MIYACILSGLAGYIIRAVIGVWKEQRLWQDAYKAGGDQQLANLAEQFEDYCQDAIEERQGALRDKKEASEW